MQKSVTYRLGPELVTIYPSYLSTEDLNVLGIPSLETRGFPQKITFTSKFPREEGDGGIQKGMHIRGLYVPGVVKWDKFMEIAQLTFI